MGSSVGDSVVLGRRILSIGETALQGKKPGKKNGCGLVLG